MNRTEEYSALLQELEETPARLNSAVARAKARARRQKLRRAFFVPASAVAAACVCFVLLVNVSGPFAQACADIPFLKGLAEAVSFNPSLSAAVENDWVQPIGLTERDNGVEMTVEYVIVDQKQLNIFYTMEGDPEAVYDPCPDMLGMDGEELSCSIIWSSARADGELHKITADFTSAGTMPDALRLECGLRVLGGDREFEPVGTFTFDLTFDPKFTEQGKVVELNRWMELDGQRILLKNVEIYPTHMRVNLGDDPDNTAWLRSLDFYAEDENGVRYETPSDIVSTGSPDSPFTQSFRLDSSFFSEGEHLTLYMTGAEWLEKDKQWTTVDLMTEETGILPGEYVLHQVTRTEDDVQLTFRVPIELRGRSNPFRSWRAPDGQEGYIAAWTGYTSEGFSDTILHLEDYPWDSVELELNYSSRMEYSTPIEIPVS